MRRSTYITLFSVAVLAILMGGSCKKTRVQTVGGILKFSVDTLKFDTVFTAAGSFTTGLLIYNPQNEEVILSSVHLAEGANSYFHLNVDGFAGNTASNIKIPAHDSIYVFATVTIDPNNKLTPFLITDSLVATMNGKDFYVGFTAYGQNAHYIIDSALAVTNAVWTDSLPYVVIWTGDATKPHGLQINPGCTLTLNKGCRVYMHQNAAMAVFGSIIANGSKTDSVIIQGDRMDRAYFGYTGYPGEWGGIYLDSKSKGNRFTHTIIQNCGNGALTGVPAAIQLAPDSVCDAANPQLFFDRSIIQNSYGYGIYSFHGTVVATNSLVSTTGQEALAIVLGGRDSITNCTFANYGSPAVSHANYGTVTILDYYWDGVTGDPTIYDTLNSVLRNCIVYGSLDSEIVCDATGTPAAIPASLRLDHCLLKMGTVRESLLDTIGCIFNQDPLFKNTATGDFHLTAGSPAIGGGTTSYMPGNDLDDVPRSTTSDDIGCYQH